MWGPQSHEHRPRVLLTACVTGRGDFPLSPQRGGLTEHLHSNAVTPGGGTSPAAPVPLTRGACEAPTACGRLTSLRLWAAYVATPVAHAVCDGCPPSAHALCPPFLSHVVFHPIAQTSAATFLVREVGGHALGMAEPRAGRQPGAVFTARANLSTCRGWAVCCVSPVRC